MTKVHVFFAAFYGGHVDGEVSQVEEAPPIVEMEPVNGLVCVYKLRMNKDGSEVFSLKQSKHVTIMLYDYDGALTRLARERRAKEAQNG